jgi:hypothetical protein
MKVPFAPKLLTAAAALGAALAFAGPAAAWHGGPHGHGPYGYRAPPPAYHAPPMAHPYHYGPRRHWGWRHHYRRPPPPWAYGPRW